MNPILRNILAVIAGIVVGSIVNMGIVTISPSIVPVDPAINPEDMNSLAENIHLLTTGNYIMTFLAHALGTLVGAFTAVKISASNHRTNALIVGAIFLLGGIYMCMTLNAPMAFEAIDVIAAYIPMGYLGWMLGGRQH